MLGPVSTMAPRPPVLSYLRQYAPQIQPLVWPHMGSGTPGYSAFPQLAAALHRVHVNAYRPPTIGATGATAGRLQTRGPRLV